MADKEETNVVDRGSVMADTEDTNGRQTLMGKDR